MSEKLNIDEQIAELDTDIGIQTWYIERAEALEKLKKMPEFQMVIMDGFINIEADRVYNLLTDPRTVKLEDKDIYLSKLDTIRNMSAYLGTETYPGTVANLAVNAKSALESAEAMKRELLLGKGE